MTALTLTRQEPHKNMARFYRLDVQPDLFGGWTLWREWGRMGHAGTVRHDGFASAQAAEEARNKLTIQKEKRGYRPTACAA